MQSIHKSVKNASVEVQKQDEKLAKVNETLDDYNKELSHCENLHDIIDIGPIAGIYYKFKGLFTWKNPNYGLDPVDQKIIN